MYVPKVVVILPGSDETDERNPGHNNTSRNPQNPTSGISVFLLLYWSHLVHQSTILNQNIIYFIYIYMNPLRSATNTSALLDI